MAELSQALQVLASAYYDLLQAGEVNRRLAHHMAHVAPELWLAQEFAFLVNG